MPPAFVTAAARLADEVRAMPARRIGWRIPRRVVSGVVRVGWCVWDVMVLVVARFALVTFGRGFTRRVRFLVREDQRGRW